MNIDFGKLTDEQTIRIAKQALAHLTDTEFVEVVVELVTDNADAVMMRDELIANLEGIAGDE